MCRWAELNSSCKWNTRGRLEASKRLFLSQEQSQAAGQSWGKPKNCTKKRLNIEKGFKKNATAS